FFFTWTAAKYTSSAPAAYNLSMTDPNNWGFISSISHSSTTICSDCDSSMLWPIRTRSTLGVSDGSRSPAPYPILSMVMGGMGPNAVAYEEINKAPVGVTSSRWAPDEYTGMPSSSFAVAGAGTGNRPCAEFTMPPPTFKGDDTMRSGL